MRRTKQCKSVERKGLIRIFCDIQEQEPDFEMEPLVKAPPQNMAKYVRPHPLEIQEIPGSGGGEDKSICNPIKSASCYCYGTE